MESIPETFICRLNGVGFVNRKEEVLTIEYGTVSNFEDFK